MRGWIGVDLDGTLAEYDRWEGPERIGPPVPQMVNRVRQWLADGADVRVFTARVWHDGTPTRVHEAMVAEQAIQAWCEQHVGRALPVTCTKDFGMIVLYDDRCVRVEKNTGRLL